MSSLKTENWSCAGKCGNCGFCDKRLSLETFEAEEKIIKREELGKQVFLLRERVGITIRPIVRTLREVFQ